MSIAMNALGELCAATALAEVTQRIRPFLRGKRIESVAHAMAASIAMGATIALVVDV